MSFRHRLTLLVAVTVAVVIAVVSSATWVFARGTLRGQIDDSLRQSSAQITVPTSSDLSTGALRLPRALLGGTLVYAQVVNTDGQLMHSVDGRGTLPVSQHVRDVAAGRSRAYFEDQTINGVHVRVYTSHVNGNEALQTARRLDEVDDSLRHLALLLLVATVGGVFVAALLGWLVARAALRPVARLTATAERLAGSRDLTERMLVTGSDELSRLGRTLNSMLDEVEEAVSAERQLVADASHELRTPLTSLRTNVEVLQHNETGLTPTERSSLLRDILAQLHELTTLVNDLVDLARGAEPDTSRVPLRLDELVEEAVERAALLHQDMPIDVDLEPCMVLGSPERLHRAVGNLLENAAKWSPAGSIVEVSVADGVITVRDHGPGFEPEDLPHVFERFYRAKAARGKPGSGLGLAIVRQVADAHLGTVEAGNADGGGALMRLGLESVRSDD